VGEALAYAYSKPGVRVVLVARNEEQLQLVANKCRAQGAEAVPCIMDVRDRGGMKRIVEQAEAVRPLDLTIAVAGHEAAMSEDEDIMHAVYDAVDVNMSLQQLTHATCASTACVSAAAHRLRLL
jgi:NADP-dependent 3-hydroxy acid dehydrogenase YdfG